MSRRRTIARVFLFLMDYPNRTRLKIIGHARVENAAEHPEFFAQLAEPEFARAVGRFFFIDTPLSIGPASSTSPLHAAQGRSVDSKL